MVPHLFHDPVWTRKSGLEAIWKRIAVEQIEKVVPLSTDCSRPPLTFQMIKLKCFDGWNSQEDVMMNRYWWKTGWHPIEIGNIWKHSVFVGAHHIAKDLVSWIATGNISAAASVLIDSRQDYCLHMEALTGISLQSCRGRVASLVYLHTF